MCVLSKRSRVDPDGVKPWLLLNKDASRKKKCVDHARVKLLEYNVIHTGLSPIQAIRGCNWWQLAVPKDIHMSSLGNACLKHGNWRP